MVTIYINNNIIDISEDIGLRLNHTLFEAGVIRQSTSEFSFSCNIPATDRNNRIMGFANALPTVNKFNRVLDAKIYADEVNIFTGQMLIDSYDADDNQYSVNFLNIKKNNLDSIFGDMLCKDIEWYEPFSGDTSINQYNSGNTKVIYPFVSYGVFIKTPTYADEVANDYTDRSIIDSTNRFYYTTFYPSMNVVEMVKRMFAKKGYDLKGTIMDDPLLNNLYMSVHLSDQQVPLYNLAQPELGTIDMAINWNSANDNDGYEQSLSFPYFKVYNRTTGHHSGGRRPVGYGSSAEYFNFDTIERWNILGASTIQSKSYLYDSGDSVIVIPADGAYRISLEYDIQVSGTSINVTEKMYSGNTGDDEDITDYQETIPVDIKETTPVELQLVRNSHNLENNIELIKGKHNKAYDGGHYGTTFREWITCYPHENLAGQLNPTVTQSVSQTLNVPNDRQYGTSTMAPATGGRSGTGTVTGHRRPANTSDTGYVYKDNDIMAYDTNVNPYFICGASSLSNGVNSVIRNGKSWYAGQAAKCNSMYNNNGYQYIQGRGTGGTVIQTEYASNSYPSAPNSYCSIVGNRMTGKLYCTVWLNRNDILTLETIHRKYDSGDTYDSTVSARLKIDALTPNNWNKAKYDNLGYYSESQFDRNLNMSNFIDNQTTAKSFIEGIMNSFNLQLTVDGNTAMLDLMKRTDDPSCSVNIDDRCNYTEAVSERIDWPQTMSVKWSINTDEYGYWTTVPYEHVNDDDWKEWGDKGYDVISLDTVYSDKDESVTLPFSYCWYMDFLDKRNANNPKIYTIPVISKYEYMAEGADYDEAMQNDGYGLNWRFWFRTPVTNNTLTLTNGDVINLLIPSNVYLNTEISYRNVNGTLLKRYHDFPIDASGDITKIDAYITMLEYQRLKSGGGVIFDMNAYKVSSIEGYDPDNKNKTTLRLTR